MVAAKTSLLGHLCLAGLLLGGAATEMAPLSASAAFGAVLAPVGPLGGAATPVRAHRGDGVVRLLLVVLAVVGGGSEDRQQLLVAVDGGGAPVGFVRAGNLLIGFLSELLVFCKKISK